MALEQSEKDVLDTVAAQLDAAATWVTGPRSRKLKLCSDALRGLSQGEDAVVVAGTLEPPPPVKAFQQPSESGGDDTDPLT